MAYPQPGQFPAYAQYPGQGGVPGNPSLPGTVRTAFYLMLAGAVLEIGSMAALFSERSQFRTIAQTLTPYATNAEVDASVNRKIVEGVVGALVYIGLWVWMALANRSGKNWARITGTVFFGIYCLIALGTLTLRSDSSFAFVRPSTAVTVITVLIFLTGLCTVILLWNKQSGPHFNPPQYGVGGPGSYPYPYQYQYGTPGQQPMPPMGAVPPQQQQQQPPYGVPPQGQGQGPGYGQPPADPWANPPQQ